MEFREAVPYVVSAYMGIWLAIVIYFLMIQGKLTALGKQLDVLAKAVDKKATEEAAERVEV